MFNSMLTWRDLDPVRARGLKEAPYYKYLYLQGEEREIRKRPQS